MDLKSDTVDKVRDILVKIEEGSIDAGEGFKNICWIADMYTIAAELDEGKQAVASARDEA